ncbi:hypothetical protein JCM5296_002708 [Sporobolomyces johnsonii]
MPQWSMPSTLVQGQPHDLQPFNPLHNVITGGGSKMKKMRSRGHRKVAFTDQPQFPSTRLPPNPSLKDIDRRVDLLIHSSKEPSTRRGYHQQLDRHWFPFLRTYNLSKKPSVETLVRFVAWVGARVRGVDKILSAVRWHYTFSDRRWQALRSNPWVRNAILGHKKLTAPPTKRSPPLLPSHLAAFVHHALQPGASYNDLLAATLTIAFQGLLYGPQVIGKKLPYEGGKTSHGTLIGLQEITPAFVSAMHVLLYNTLYNVDRPAPFEKDVQGKVKGKGASKKSPELTEGHYGVLYHKRHATFDNSLTTTVGAKRLDELTAAVIPAIASGQELAQEVDKAGQELEELFAGS